jgi:acyl-coenzyme A thioesterase PaaI-like protein
VDLESLTLAMRSAVPFVRTLGVEFVSVSPGPQVVVALPDTEATHNHVGGPHAGAMFALGEIASGSVVMAVSTDLLGRGLPLVVRGEIAYRRLALSGVRASARLGRPIEDIVAELDAGARPEFDVPVEITTEDGTAVAEMLVVWTVRPNR